MSKQQPVIALTGGGSGGHIVPLLSLARELKLQAPGCEIIYIGHKGDNFDTLNLPRHDFDFLSFINAGKFRRYHGESLLSHLLDVKTIALNMRDFFRLLASITSAYKILSRTHTDVVFAKGGFVSVPVGIAARLKRIPIVTHDSDALGGLANRIVGHWARVRTTGMPTDLYKKGKARLEYVGIPLDSKIVQVTPAQQAGFKKELGLPSGSQVLLIAGGGLGSQKVNDMIIQAAPRLLQANLALHILHVTGQQHLKAVKAGYQDVLDATQLKKVECIGFTPDFYVYSGAADLIVSRAGATAIAEFAVQAKPCVIIPSPFLTGGHQLKNAAELARQDAAVILDETADTDEVTGIINHLLSDDQRRSQLSQNIHKTAKPGAAAKLARIILGQAG
jgi:UDP-N-acetylglucosamine--N-acetylmuramyl-(pentapeptide) pyrophosphoryl-undecaprenol N-acetylglucosamine transferase